MSKKHDWRKDYLEFYPNASEEEIEAAQEFLEEIGSWVERYTENNPDVTEEEVREKLQKILDCGPLH